VVKKFLNSYAKILRTLADPRGGEHQ